MESLEMTESKVMSETPTCFFLNPSFQSACVSHSECQFCVVWSVESERLSDLDETASLRCFLGRSGGIGALLESLASRRLSRVSFTAIQSAIRPTHHFGFSLDRGDVCSISGPLAVCGAKLRQSTEIGGERTRQVEFHRCTTLLDRQNDTEQRGLHLVQE